MASGKSSKAARRGRQAATAVASTAAKDSPAGARRPSKQNPDQRHWIADWTLNILILLFATTTVVQAFVVPSASMEAGILIGDHMLVDKLAYAPGGSLSRFLLPYRDVRRGDVIVFRYPVDIAQTYIKRCIGIPGDRLKLVNKTVYLNGKALSEPYVQHTSPIVLPYRDDFPSTPPNQMVAPQALEMLRDHVQNGELVVPPDMYFAMGDNRDDSADSRFWGFVPRQNIVGKPVIIFWSYDAPTAELSAPTPGLDHLVDMAFNFFSKTRWRRTFRLVRPYSIS
jgi:signal peptidase I